MTTAELAPIDVEAELNERGFALVRNAIDPAAARELRGLYDDARLFRSRVVMQNHNFGRGEYQYFSSPLPSVVQALRDDLYAALVPTAAAWTQTLGGAGLASGGATALLLKYGPGDYNCLHQDVYGPVWFPLQATLYLSRPGEEFDGGEVVLTEQRPRAQSRAHVLTPRQGDLLVLPTRSVPRPGKRGTYRATFRHGVGTVTRGERFTLGIILATQK